MSTNTTISFGLGDNEPLTSLPKDADSKQIQKFLIVQVNQLIQDIKDIEELKQYIKNLFPSDQSINRRSIYVLENKLKTMTSLYSTILSYKQELNRLLLKLQMILDPGIGENDLKAVIQSVIQNVKDTSINTESHRTKLKKFVSSNPNFMPSTT